MNLHRIRWPTCCAICVFMASMVFDAAGETVAEPVVAAPETRTTHVTPKPGDRTQRGNASFYSKHLSGHKTASGEPYDPNALTAAHRTLPMGTKVKVVNPKNDRSVVVTVNDRGPVPKNRVIDLSSAAARELGMTKAGVTKVETEVVAKPSASASASDPP